MLTRTVRPLLAEQYADMLAQDYRLRNVLLSSYHHDFSSLLQFDRRMQAYLDGMLLLKEETSEYLRGQLQELLSPGELFSVGLFAANANDEFLLSGCLGLVQGMPRLLPSLLAVTGWMSEASGLWPLIMSHPACRAYISMTRNQQLSPRIINQQEIMALIEQNQCVVYLLCFLHASGSSLFISALNMVLSSKRDEIKICGCRAVFHMSGLPDEYIRIARENLYQLAKSQDSNVRTQAVKYLIIYSSADSSSVINDLTQQEVDIHLKIQAMGWSGLTEYIPTLMNHFEESDYARLSALAVICITGSLPERDGWQRKIEDIPLPKVDSDSAEIPINIPEQGVCWPDGAGFQHWWHTQGSRFSNRSHYLGGQVPTPENLSAILTNGYLNLRPLAAMRSGKFSELTSLPSECQLGIFTAPSTSKQGVTDAKNTER